ncbi:lysostaphin resistance A-like protein [Moraxella sp. ZJ142]|uniref:CPBP family intramembrane glutamic endopeptidase n=1 Tax=Moraxella marmotae TaxID=3344520 RepID=UPI0035D3DA3C
MPNNQLPSYRPTTAALLVIATVSSVFVLQNAWQLLMNNTAQAICHAQHAVSCPSNGTLAVISLILTAISMIALLVIWQYFRLKNSPANRQDLKTHRQAIARCRQYLGIMPIKLTKSNAKILLQSVCLLFAAIILSSFLVAMIGDMLGTDATPTAGVSELLDDGTPIWLFSLLVLVFAPAYEELICRGLFWRLGWDIFSPIVSTPRQMAIATSVLSSVIFALLHFRHHLMDMMVMFAISLAMCYARIRTGSVFAPMLLHGLNNALALCLILLD